MSRNAKLYFCGLLESGADPVKELYPFIDDYAWALAQQYEHITIGGVQYPFQDSAKATPVTANGDPVGAVVGLRGTPDAEEPVSAERAVWGASGLSYTGTGRIELPRANGNIDFIHQTATGTLIAHLKRASGGAFRVISASAISVVDIGYFWRFTTANQLQFSIIDGTGFIAATTSATFPVSSTLAVYAVSVTPTHVHFYLNGVLAESVAWTPSTNAGISTRDVGIGCIGGSSTQIFVGDYAGFWAVDTALDATQILQISTGLLA